MRNGHGKKTKIVAHKRNGKGLHKGLYAVTATSVLRPLKRANRKVVTFVTHKPAKTLGLAAIVTGLCVSLAYARRLWK